MSVTDLGEPALVRAASIEIARGTVLAGRYQVEAVIGKGGSGIVLRAFDRVAQVPVAVKILKAELASDPRWIERFSRELRLARQIQHPNVCRVFDIGQADGHWFITMELATAGTLRDQLAPGHGLRPVEERVVDVRAVVAGLAAIHDAGIVHRDVKPDNFLRMQDGRLVLSDFGLATNPGEAPTVSIMVGTPYYMAPEVVMGEPATQRSDVWATGVVIHEILTGSRPERSCPTRARPAKAAAGTTRLEKALLRLAGPCLATEPSDRPEHGGALQRCLDAAIATPRRFGLFGPSARGRQLAWSVVALATLALFAVSGRRLWQPAAASSSEGSRQAALITTTGTPRDWSVGAKRLAELDGRLHCFSILPAPHTARVVWGTPRRAQDIDLVTGVRTASPLPREAFAVGCPQLAPQGERLLFTHQPAAASPQIMLANADGTDAKTLTNGTEPVWLPNGQEFLFNLDASHAGVFSLPTMSYNLLNEDRGQSKKLLYRKAISAQGDLLAIIYNSDNMKSRVLEMHSLPSLDVVETWKVPFSILGVSFDDQRLFLTDIDNGGALERLDWRSGRAERVGKVPGHSLRSVISASAGPKVLLSSARRDDAWVFEPGQVPRQLTDDGRSYSASWSPSGEILVGRLLDDGRFVIVLYDRNGKSRQVTNGPSDSVPSFSADGSEWLYAAYDRKAIVRCKGDLCGEVVHHEQLPMWPVLAPDRQLIAFVTGYGAPRIHVVRANGEGKRDLGPTAFECPPIWTSSRSLWAFSGAGATREWVEIDVATGTRTGRSKPATTFDPDEGECGWESETPTSAFYRPVRIIPRESWEIATQTARLPGLD